MKSLKKLVRGLLVGAILWGGTLSGVADVGAQEKGSTLAQQIQGSWILGSIYTEKNGKKSEVFGPNPRGFLNLAPDGRFVYILLRASLPKFTDNNRMKGTAEENQAVVQGSFAVYGRYTVLSDKEHLVKLHIEGSTFPNWDGQDQKRIVTVSGDEMKVINPHSTVEGTDYFVWKRAK